MALTVTEACAVNTVIYYLVTGDAERDDLDEALRQLQASASKRLGAGITEGELAKRLEVPAPGSALAAEAVCQALRTHLSHGGSLPWPLVRRPYEAWAGEA